MVGRKAQLLKSGFGFAGSRFMLGFTGVHRMILGSLYWVLSGSILGHIGLIIIRTLVLACFFCLAVLGLGPHPLIAIYWEYIEALI